MSCCTPPKAALFQFDQEDERESFFSCRVCWEQEASDANLLSPCKCAGTQKHVHLKCLRRWQENVQKRDASDERAFRCSVCRTLFSVPPPQARSSALALQAVRGVGGILCISLLAFGLSGPPWPHLALLVLLLLASRSHWLPGLALLVVCSALATMHARGLRVILRVDGGGRLGLALIRQGAPIAGVGPGVLLVASEGLDHSMFRRSVVLLTQHGRGGARGVILTQPMPTPPATGVLGGEADWEAAAQPGGSLMATAADSAGAAAGAAGGATDRGRAAARRAAAQGGGVALRHFLGGPVGMPGEGVNHEVLVLHSVPGVAGARRLVPPPNETAATAAGAGAATYTTSSDGVTGGAAQESGVAADGGNAPRAAGGSADSAVGSIATAASTASTAGINAFQLYEGGALAEVLERAAGASAAAAARAMARRGGPAPGQPAGAVFPVLLFHGVCAWAEGQLEGELRAGAWSFSNAALGPALLGMPPDQLWRLLADSPSLARVA